MAVNKATWIRNLFGAPEPLRVLGLFQAGSTQAIKRGEILEKTADTNTRWVPIDSDFSMSANIAIADEEIKVGDLAGYYWIIVPRPGDVFEYELAAAAAVALGDGLYFSTSQKVATSGSNVLGNVAGAENYPKQGHVADAGEPDQGETKRSLSFVRMTFKAAASYYAALQT